MIFSQKRIFFLILYFCTVGYLAGMFRPGLKKCQSKTPLTTGLSYQGFIKPLVTKEEREHFEAFKKLMSTNERAPQLTKASYDLFQKAQKSQLRGSYIDIIARRGKSKEFAKKFIAQNQNDLSTQLQDILTLKKEKGRANPSFLQAIGRELVSQQSAQQLTQYAAMDEDIALGVLQGLCALKTQKIDEAEKEKLFHIIFNSTPKTNLFVSRILNALASSGKFSWIDANLINLVDHYVHEAASISPILTGLNKNYAQSNLNDQLIMLVLLEKLAKMHDATLQNGIASFIATRLNDAGKRIGQSQGVPTSADARLIQILAYDKNLWQGVLAHLRPETLASLVKSGLFKKNVKFIQYAFLYGTNEQIKAMRVSLPASGAVAKGISQIKNFFNSKN